MNNEPVRLYLALHRGELVLEINSSEITIKVPPRKYYREKIKEYYDEDKAWDITDEIEQTIEKDLKEIKKKSEIMTQALLAYIKTCIMESQTKISELFEKKISEASKK